jgi:MFS transporter, OFA family, oxalate/formate antiporter
LQIKKLKILIKILIVMNEMRLFGLPARQGRWGFIPLGIVAQLCLGTVYSWSIFRKPLEKALTIKDTESLLPFAVLLAVFALVMPIAGRYIERFGARRVTAFGGLVTGLGYWLTGFATNVPTLVLTYGLIAGAGVGITYGVPLAVAAKWFPDRKGLAVGLTVVGFGLSPLITVPFAKGLIAEYGISKTFMILGITFASLICLVASQLRFPPTSWLPNPTGPVNTTPAQDAENLWTEPNFYGLWICYIIGTLAGLMAIGISADVGKEVIKLDKETAATAVSIFAIFNGVGRPIFGWLTDRLKPRRAAILSYVMILVASIVMMNAKDGQNLSYFFAFALFWLSLGGWLAIAPTATLALFSPKNYARNYGLVFTAYGIGALAGTFIAASAKSQFGSYTAAFYATAVLAMVGIGIASMTFKPGKKSLGV